MITPVPFLANAWTKALPPQLDGFREVLDGLIELPLGKRDEAQVVEALRVPIEAIDEQTEHRCGPLVLAALIQAGRVLLGIGRHVATLQSKPPVEEVIHIPFAWCVVPELQPPCDQFGQIRELMVVLLDDIRGRLEILRIREDELAREPTQVVPEMSAEPLRPVLVTIWQHAEVLLDRPANLLPVELEIRVLLFEQLSKSVPAALGATPERLQRFRLRVKREEDPLLNCPGVGLPFAVNDGQLIPSLTDVCHVGLAVRVFVSRRRPVVQRSRL